VSCYSAFSVLTKLSVGSGASGCAADMGFVQWTGISKRAGGEKCSSLRGEPFNLSTIK